MCQEKFAKQVDRAVFPGMQGGPHDHITAAKAVAFGEALKPEFKEYAKKVIVNAQAMAADFLALGYKIVSGGTDNHLFVLDLSNKGLSGKEAEKVLETVGISVSRSTIPNDPNPPMNPSGVRIGTPAVTTRGMGETEIKQIVDFIDLAITHKDDLDYLNNLKADVRNLCLQFPTPR
jgi:glycine hydroxymethyltransferase